MQPTAFLSAAVLALICGVHASALAAPETYTIDSGHTFPRFSYSHMGLSTQLSRFSKTTGTVVLDKAAKTGSVDVVIDMKTVETGLAVFNGHI
jgi:polyisoprenoid-binding protein YceI